MRTEWNNNPNSEANQLKRELFKSAKERQKPQKIDHCTLKQILHYKNAYKFYNTKLFRKRILKNGKKKGISKEEIAKIVDYDHQNIYSPQFEPNSISPVLTTVDMTIMNSHSRKPFKSIDATNQLSVWGNILAFRS